MSQMRIDNRLGNSLRIKVMTAGEESMIKIQKTTKLRMQEHLHSRRMKVLPFKVHGLLEMGSLAF